MPVGSEFFPTTHGTTPTIPVAIHTTKTISRELTSSQGLQPLCFSSYPLANTKTGR